MGFFRCVDSSVANSGGEIVQGGFGLFHNDGYVIGIATIDDNTHLPFGSDAAVLPCP
jgi:hypothetical protein